MTKIQINNSDAEKHTRITSWVKFKSLELSVFALEIRESLLANLVTHEADVHLRFIILQLLEIFFFN